MLNMNEPDLSLLDDDVDDVDDVRWRESWPESAMEYNATHQFANTYLKCYETGERRDAFYIPSLRGPKTAIILALHVEEPQCSPSQLEDPENVPGGNQNSTVRMVPRLFFPAQEDDLNAYGWESRDKRDLAATWIQGSFDKLQTEKLLTACAAGLSDAGIDELLKGDLQRFKLSLGTVLRRPALAPSSVGRPVPEFTPEASATSLSRLAVVTVDGIDQFGFTERRQYSKTHRMA
jgi:hypothetical protein